MAIGGYCGSFTLTNGSTADVVVSDAVNITSQPQWVMFFYANKSGTGTGTGTNVTGFGMTDGTRHFALGSRSADAVTSTASDNFRTNTGCIVQCSSTSTSGDGKATGCTMTANGFTLTIGTAFATTKTCYYVCGWGFDNAFVKVDQFSAGTGNQAFTGVGFQPSAAFFMRGGSTTIDAGSTTANLSFGWATASAQAAMTFRQAEGAASNYTWGMISTALCAVNGGTTGGAQIAAGALVSFDADGFTINKTVATTSYFGALCLKGGVPVATTTTAQSGTGTFDVTTTGCLPRIAFGMMTDATASQSSSTEPAHFTVGAIAGGAQFSLEILSQNNEPLAGAVVTEEYSVTATNAFLTSNADTGADTLTQTSAIAASSFSNDKVTLNQTDGDPAAKLIPILVLGDAVSGAVSFRTRTAGSLGTRQGSRSVQG